MLTFYRKTSFIDSLLLLKTTKIPLAANSKTIRVYRNLVVKLLNMKQYLLFDDGNAIARSFESACRKARFELDVYRDNVDVFSITEFLTSPAPLLKKLESQTYDGMIIAPMFFEYDNSNFQALIDRNLKFPEVLMSHASKFVKSGGSIVNLASSDYMLGSYMSKYYSAVMAGKMSLTKGYANTLGPQNIRVNTVAPGWIESVIEDSMDESEKSKKIAKGMEAKAKEMTPLGRKGRPDEIADVFMFLLSDASTFINGQAIVVDGGYSCVDAVTKCEYELNKSLE
jgi:NAD(P)-dependent dehydrogenase (short-subunit alcohol dehydrogenase family)